MMPRTVRSTIPTRLARCLRVLAVAVVALALAAAAAQENRTVTLLHDTHFHGKFGDPDGAFIARYATLVQELRGGSGDVLFVGNGDDLAPSLLASVHHGSHMIEAMNVMGLDVNTLGNHEFDYGPDNLLQQLQASTTQWVTANIVDDRTGDAFGAEVGVRRWVVRELSNGLRVGFTGFAPADTPEVTTLGPNARMVPTLQAAREVVDGMRAEGADLIVMLAHICRPAVAEIVTEVPGFDVVVGDHCSTVLEQPEWIGDTLVSRVGDEFDYLGELTLHVGTDGLAGFDFTLHAVDEAIEPHAEIDTIVERYESALDEALAGTVGETAVPLDVRREAVRSVETNIGNFIADVMREATGADIALQNGGSIRADRIIEPGPLSKRDVIETLPFENYVVVIEMPGSAIREALELSVSTVEEGHGRFLQVSGLRFVYDPTAEPMQRVREVTVHGEPLNDDGTYSVATNSFTAGGGDGYGMMEGRPTLLDAASGPLHSVLIEEAIRDRTPIAPELDGRIAVVGAN